MLWNDLCTIRQSPSHRTCHETIRATTPVIDIQLDTGYGSSSDFRNAFSKIMGAPPSKLRQDHNQHHKILKASWIDTVLGPMIAISDDAGLYLLEFVDKRGLEAEIQRLKLKTKAAIIPGHTQPIKSITLELKAYFNGDLKNFTSPVHLLGTPFQRLVWEELLRIPYGQTKSYASQAQAVGKPTAYRAVANANGANQLTLIIPCHRIINSNGDLGGYGGGMMRKKWLIDHEKNHV